MTSLPNDELTVDEENDEILIAVVVKKEGFPDVTLCRVVLNKPILDVSLLKFLKNAIVDTYITLHLFKSHI